MKPNPNFAVTARLQALGLVAAILSPGMVLAKPVSFSLGDGLKSSVAKSHPEQKPAASDHSVPPVMQFNAIDGQPIR